MYISRPGPARNLLMNTSPDHTDS